MTKPLSALHLLVAYWGDIDTWGLAISSDVRSRQVNVTALMMNLETLQQHENRMVVEKEPVADCPEYLTEIETKIFYGLKSGKFQNSRLEEERLSVDYIVSQLKNWEIGSEGIYFD